MMVQRINVLYKKRPFKDIFIYYLIISSPWKNGY